MAVTETRSDRDRRLDELWAELDTVIGLPDDELRQRVLDECFPDRDDLARSLFNITPSLCGLGYDFYNKRLTFVKGDVAPLAETDAVDPETCPVDELRRLLLISFEALRADDYPKLMFCDLTYEGSNSYDLVMSTAMSGWNLSAERSLRQSPEWLWAQSLPVEQRLRDLMTAEDVIDDTAPAAIRDHFSIREFLGVEQITVPAELCLLAGERREFLNQTRWSDIFENCALSLHVLQPEVVTHEMESELERAIGALELTAHQMGGRNTSVANGVGRQLDALKSWRQGLIDAGKIEEEA